MNSSLRRLHTLLFLICLTQAAHAADHDIRAYGAVGDGKTLNTAAIQAAIDKANAEGGGRVIVPAGRFLSGELRLKSSVELHLTPKAVIVGSTDPADYPIAHEFKAVGWKALVMGYQVQNAAITGRGVLDGQGDRLALKVDSLFYAGKIDSVDYEFKERRPKWHQRPLVVQFVQSKGIRVQDITVRNSACWVQCYVMSEDITIDGIRVESDTYWNNDGIDIIDCRNVRITDCYINSSDDGICLKSWATWAYPATEISFCDSIYISNCTIRSSASAVKFGTSSWNGFKNVVIKDIKVFDTFRSAIAIEVVTGGFLENVLVDGIKATNTGNAIFVRLGSQHKAPGTLKNVVIRNLQADISFDAADRAYRIRGPELPFFHNVFPSSITGIPGAPVQDLTLENIKITYPGKGNPAYANLPAYRIKDVPEQVNVYPEYSMFGELPAWGFYVRHVQGLTLRNVQVKIKEPDYRPAMVLDDVKGLKMEGVDIQGDDKPGTGIIQKDVQILQE